MNQKPPQRIDAPKQSSNPATFIFLHGLGDDADGWTSISPLPLPVVLTQNTKPSNTPSDIAQQFHSANKLPHLSWVFPNAPHNHEHMTTAWYSPTSFTPIPVGRSSASPAQEEHEDEGFDEEGEDEILASCEYLCSLIDAEVARGVKSERVVIGGFSQGCAISLVTALVGRWAGRVGGVVGLSGYLPRGKKIREGRTKYVQSVEGDGKQGMTVFLAHGTRDMLVPMRVYRDALARVEKTVGENVVESHIYEGMGHVTSGVEFRDMCTFLEKVVPE